MLGFYFDGNPGEHTIYLTEDLRTNNVEKLGNCIREGNHGKEGISFKEFQTYLAKLRNALIPVLDDNILLYTRN